MLALVVGAASVSLVGCGDGATGIDPNLVPVTGKVSVNGKSLDHGRIMFVNEKSDRAGSPSSEIGKDGSYSLQMSPSAKGALPGDYKVVVESTEGSPSIDTTNGKPILPKSLVPEKFTKAATTDSKATVDAKKKNQLDIDLKE